MFDKHSDGRLCFKLPSAQYLILNRDELMYVEADREICHLNLANGERLSVTNHLGYYKQVLIEQFGFMEVSKSVIVNANHIIRYKTRERLLQLSGGQEVTVSNSRKEELAAFFKEMYQQWE
jgi:DNA-binding LytR/AlgR family response regulator